MFGGAEIQKDGVLTSAANSTVEESCVLFIGIDLSGETSYSYGTSRYRIELRWRETLLSLSRNLVPLRGRR